MSGLDRGGSGLGVDGAGQGIMGVIEVVDGR